MSLGNSVGKSFSHLRSSLRWSTGHLFSKVGPAHCVPLTSTVVAALVVLAVETPLFRFAFVFEASLICTSQWDNSHVSNCNPPSKRSTNRLTRLTRVSPRPVEQLLPLKR